MVSERKIWVPLGASCCSPKFCICFDRCYAQESNPIVMTSLAHALGMSATLALYDIYTLEPSFLSAPASSGIPRPIHALLFNFPLTEANESFLKSDESHLPDYDGCGKDEPVMHFRQTIGHACGLIGLLHCLTNNPDVTAHVCPESTLYQLIQDATPLHPDERAQWLYDSPVLERIHAAHAQRGDSTPPPDPATWADGQGFVAFVKGKDGHLWEMEGRRKGPVDRGIINQGDDMLSENVLKRSVEAFLERERKAGSGEIKFSLLGLGKGIESE